VGTLASQLEIWSDGLATVPESKAEVLTGSTAYRFLPFHSSYEMRGIVMKASRVRA
jgi:hypothetical protein